MRWPFRFGHDEGELRVFDSATMKLKFQLGYDEAKPESLWFTHSNVWYFSHDEAKSESFKVGHNNISNSAMTKAS